MGEDKSSNQKWITPVLLLLVAIPISMLMWIGNLALLKLRDGTTEAIPPTRWLAATLIPLGFAAWGYRRRSVNKSGAIAGLVIAFVLTLGSYAFLMDLVVFFVSSSQASKFKARRKTKISQEFKEGAERNWIQALCNAGMAAQLGLLYLLDSGAGERSIDFTSDYRSSWLSLGVLGAFACANADTWASELGTVLSKDNPFLITSGTKVPKGVNGGVSWIGLVLSAGGGAAVGAGHYLALWLTSSGPGGGTITALPAQWPLVPLAALAGLFGSILDSVLGATLQYSGWDKKREVVVETPGPGVKYICGHRILDNNSVNLLSTVVTGLVTPRLTAAFWPR